ncbi:carbohydrate ABC transporter permease [Microbacterium murale]|uniref:Sugar ABC transporter permease n=1 Tax=Microbacterium murale TaxID=1081040 RepID=A0ABQ1RDQ2_9MICO|nr:carbohydrate ABC transporter permease [Microbacterium murale]GGD65033.1 sugar ABC transporter permease [Microbacterium murale]
MRRLRRAQPISTLFLVLIAFVTLAPLGAFALASLQPAGSLVSGVQWPEVPHWENFARAWTDANFALLIRNSFLILLCVVPATLLISILAGFAFGTMTFRGRSALYLYLILGLTVPVEMIIIPLYFDFQSLGLIGSYWPIILSEIGLFIPFGVFWMTAYFRSVPRALIEAAQIDGATDWKILWRVLVPGARPALTTLGVLTFIWSWNQFLLILVLIQNSEMRTAPAGLGYFVGEHSIDVPSLAAATFIVMAPPLIVYLIFQRQFITGTLAGALKG